MTTDRDDFERRERLLDELISLDGAERANRLDALSIESPGDAAQLRDWLDAIDRSPDFMSGAFAESAPLEHGESDVGPWRPVRRIGKGGMGEVWLGVRADGAFERTVAIKYILADSVRLRASLEAERKLLARLDHPGIARLLDGGVSATGQPYLVAEFVDGVAIDVWCRNHHATLSERLRLFREVCAAVAHAHTQLIVHRDIKPANVLVDAAGHVKLLDFGIAQAVERADQDQAHEAVPLSTPGFATPELLRDGSYSTRSDIYALGALLYVLVTDRTPGRDHAPDPAHVARTSPRPPSDFAEPVLSASRRLLQDIDAIALKALADTPGDRYANVDLLLADLDNARDHRPLVARPPNTLDALSRYLLRNRVEVGIIAILVFAVAGLAWQSYRAHQATLRAEQEARNAVAVRDFLVNIFESASPIENRGAIPDAVALVDRGERRIDTELKGQPDLQAQLLEVLATINIQLGRYEPALAMARKGRELLVVQGDEFSPSAIRLTSRAAEAAYSRGGDNAEVRVMLDRAIEHLSRGEHDRDPQLIYAKIYRAGLGSLDANTDASVALFQEAIAAARTLGPAGERPLSLALHGLGLTHEMGHRPKDAVAPFREALQLRERLLGRDHPEAVATRVNLAYVTAETGAPAEAESVLRAAVESNRKVFSESHPLVAQSLNVLANVLIMQGKLDDADRALQEALEIARRTTPADSPQIDAALGSLAMLNYRRGDLVQAGDYTRQSLAMRERRNGTGDDSTLLIKQNLAVLEYRVGNYRDAEQQLRDVLERRRKTGSQISGALMHLGNTLRLQGRPAEALPLLDEAIALAEKDRGAAGNTALAARMARAAVRRDLGALAEATADADAAVDGLHRLSPSHAQLPEARYLRAQLGALCGDCARALPDLDAMRAKRHGPPAPAQPWQQWQAAEAELWVRLCRPAAGDGALEQSRRVLLASPIADPFARRLAQRGAITAAKTP